MADDEGPSSLAHQELEPGPSFGRGGQAVGQAMPSWCLLPIPRPSLSAHGSFRMEASLFHRREKVWTKMVKLDCARTGIGTQAWQIADQSFLLLS